MPDIRASPLAELAEVQGISADILTSEVKTEVSDYSILHIIQKASTSGA